MTLKAVDDDVSVTFTNWEAFIKRLNGYAIFENLECVGPTGVWHCGEDGEDDCRVGMTLPDGAEGNNAYCTLRRLLDRIDCKVNVENDPEGVQCPGIDEEFPMLGETIGTDVEITMQELSDIDCEYCEDQECAADTDIDSPCSEGQICVCQP